MTDGVINFDQFAKDRSKLVDSLRFQVSLMLASVATWRVHFGTEDEAKETEAVEKYVEMIKPKIDELDQTEEPVLFLLAYEVIQMTHSMMGSGFMRLVHSRNISWKEWALAQFPALKKLETERRPDDEAKLNEEEAQLKLEVEQERLEGPKQLRFLVAKGEA